MPPKPPLAELPKAARRVVVLIYFGLINEPNVCLPIGKGIICINDISVKRILRLYSLPDCMCVVSAPKQRRC